MVSLMTALWFCELAAPRTASRSSRTPRRCCTRSTTCSAISTASTYATLRAYGGLQSYPSRTKDPDPVDYSTGSVGIGATAPIWGAIARRYLEHHRFEAPPMGRQIALLGDAELDEGAVWEALADPLVAKLGEVLWIVDLNRQSLDRVVPDIAAGRLASMFEAAGLALPDGQVRAAARVAVRAPGRRRAAAADRRDAQRGVPAPAALPRRTSCASGCRAGAASRARAAASASSTTASCAPPSATSAATTSRRWSTPTGRRPRAADRALRLHDQGLVAADRGPPGEPLGAADRTSSSPSWPRRSAPIPTTPGRSSPTGSPEAGLLRAGGRRGCARAARAARPPPAVPPSSAARTAAPSPPSRPSAASSWTSRTGAPEVAERVVTVSPDVASSTNLGGWINKSEIWSVGDRRDWFADDTRHAGALARDPARAAHRAGDRRDEPRRPARRARRHLEPRTASRCCRSARSTTRSSAARWSRGRSACTRAGSRSWSAPRRGLARPRGRRPPVDQSPRRSASGSPA